jgi:hypothetical protein
MSTKSTILSSCRCTHTKRKTHQRETKQRKKQTNKQTKNKIMTTGKATDLCNLGKAGSSNDVDCLLILPDVPLVQLYHYILHTKP